MPLLVLFAKITPHHIEATVFAFITGISNLSSTVISPWMGAVINDTFVHVGKSNLPDIYILVLISICMMFVPLAFLWLIPSRKELDEL